MITLISGLGYFRCRQQKHAESFSNRKKKLYKQQDTFNKTHTEEMHHIPDTQTYTKKNITE